MVVTDPGPTEVHKITVAREVLKDYEPISQLFPNYVRYEELQRAEEHYTEVMRAH